jgi:hypothetical protein
MTSLKDYLKYIARRNLSSFEIPFKQFTSALKNDQSYNKIFLPSLITNQHQNKVSRYSIKQDIGDVISG